MQQRGQKPCMIVTEASPLHCETPQRVSQLPSHCVKGPCSNTSPPRSTARCSDRVATTTRVASNGEKSCVIDSLTPLSSLPLLSSEPIRKVGTIAREHSLVIPHRYPYPTSNTSDACPLCYPHLPAYSRRRFPQRLSWLTFWQTNAYVRYKRAVVEV